MSLEMTDFAPAEFIFDVVMQMRDKLGCFVFRNKIADDD